MEGLTHYISSEAIIKILKNIKEISNESQILIEYAPPFDSIQEDIIITRARNVYSYGKPFFQSRNV